MFELRGEDHVHEDHGQTEGQQKILAGFLQLLGAASEEDLVIGRQIRRSNGGPHVLHGIAQRIARAEVAHDGHLALALEAVNLVWPAGFLHANEVRQLDETGIGAVGRATSGGPEHNLLDGFLGVAVFGISAQPDIVLVIGFFVRSDNIAADERVQRVGDIRNAQTELAGLGSIDAHLQFRFTIG